MITVVLSKIANLKKLCRKIRQNIGYIKMYLLIKKSNLSHVKYVDNRCDYILICLYVEIYISLRHRIDSFINV